MDFYVNKDSGVVALNDFDRATISNLQGLKRGPIPIRVKYLKGQIPRVEADTTFTEFVLKERGKYDQPPVAIATNFSVPNSVDGWYEATLDGDTEEIRALLFVNGAASDDLATINLMGEFTWRELEDSPRNKSATIPIEFGNCVRGDDESTAASAAPLRLVAHYPAISDLTGGEATDLDSVLTTSLAVGTVVSFYYNSTFQFWRLTAGTTAENPSGGIVRPDDFDTEDNAKVWTRLSTFDPAALVVKVTVANQTARYALTTASVQNGDFVYQTDTAILYEVIDQTQLGNSSGYVALTSLPWSAITGKPTTISGYGITDAATIAAAAAPVQSVNGMTGAVTLESDPPVTTAVAYVDVNGDDLTAVIGKSTKPFETVQAAFDAVVADRVINTTQKYIIQLGVGAFAGITCPDGVPAYIFWRGVGPTHSSIATLTTPVGVDGTHGSSDGLTAPTNGASGKSISLYSDKSLTFLSITQGRGGSGGDVDAADTSGSNYPGVGGSGGNFIAIGCIIGAATVAVGGFGGNDNTFTVAGGTGGQSGYIEFRDTIVANSITGPSPGTGGAGGYSGEPGMDSQGIIEACIIRGTFTGGGGMYYSGTVFIINSIVAGGVLWTGSTDTCLLQNSVIGDFSYGFESIGTSGSLESWPGTNMYRCIIGGTLG